MNRDFELSLDELIDFILTDKYIKYSVDEINQLQAIMQKKLQLILEKDEHEFYKGVIDELIEEMIVKMANDESKNYVNPLKERYDVIGDKLCHDINENLNKPIVPKIINAIKYSHQSLINFTICNIGNFSNILTNACSLRVGNNRLLYLGNESGYSGDGENTNDLLTELGRPKNA